MKVEVERRGGFAGVTLTGSADTAKLPPSQRSGADAALNALPFGHPAPAAAHPDGFQYVISLAEGPAGRSAVLNEADLPDGLRPVIETAMAGGRLI